MVYQERTYRYYGKTDDLIKFEVKVSETDLYILARKNLKKEAEEAVLKYRRQIENYIARDPGFLSALKPYKIREDAPAIVKEMSESAGKSGVGPMASVAGAVAQHVGNDLLKYSDEIIIENGGDIFLKSGRSRKIGIFSGQSFIDKNIVLEIPPCSDAMGICTSSGRIGHSLSFGKADAVTVISHNVMVADAAATATGNLVKEPSDIKKGIEFARAVPQVKGVLIVMGGDMGVWGEGIKLVPG